MVTRWRSDTEDLSTPAATRARVEGLLDVGRWRTLLMLGAHGPAKPQGLAKHTRLSSRETLDHLQALHQLDLVEREVSDAQDRYAQWKVIRGGFDITALAASDDPQDQETYLRWLTVITQHQMMALGDWRRDWTHHPAEARRNALSQERVLVAMSSADMAELDHEMSEVIGRWHQRARHNSTNPAPNTDYQPVFLIAHAVPLEQPDRGN